MNEQIKDKKSRQVIALLCLITVLFGLTACAAEKESDNTGKDKQRQSISQTDFMLDTTVTLTIYDWQDESIFDDVFAEMRRLESLLSVDAKGSEAELLWQNAGVAWTTVSPETLELLEKSIAYSQLTEGYFDVTAGPLILLWNIREGKGHYPDEQELQEAKEQINYEDILLQNDNEVMLKRAGMKVNFGAIAKGYIADRVKDLLLEKGVKSAIINLGGNVVIVGEPPEGGAFRVGVQDPLGETGKIIGVLEIKDKSLVSSGSYERYFEYEGKRYHHILNPFTGFPEENGLAGVTVVTDQSVDGDALSTSVFLLGKEKGLALLEGIDGAEGIFVTQDGEISVTSGLEGKLLKNE